MSIVCAARTPVALWEELNLRFIGKNSEEYWDENTGISVQSFHNTFAVRDWVPEEQSKPLLKLMGQMGYSEDGTKITQLSNKYLDPEQMGKLGVALAEYREKDRFTLGMTFENSPARSGGCLTGLQIVKYKGREEAVIYAKIVEIPKKFAADLYFFNGLFRALLFHGPVRITTTCIFFWKVTAPLLVPIFGLERFKHPTFRAHVIKKIKARAHLASPEYKYRNEARTWEYLKPVIDKMIKEGDLDV